MRTTFVAVGVALLALALTLPPTVVATGTLMSDFRSMYPSAAGTKLDSCVTCHATASGGALNAYGSALGSNGHSFSAIENQDSDGDGVANGEEIERGTFPGDASDFPSGDGGGRVAGYVDVASGGDFTAAAIASDGDRGEALAVWVEQAEVARAGGEVYSQLMNDDGELVGKRARLDKGDAASSTGLSAGYGKKVFLVAWSSETGDALVRVVKAKKGKASRGPNAVVADAGDPAVGWDGNTFLVAVTTAGEVAVDRVNNKGAALGRSAARMTVDGLDDVVGFATDVPAAGALLVGSASSGSKAAPLGVVLEGGGPVSTSATFGKNRKGTPQGGAAYAADGGGLAAWVQAGKIWMVGLDEEGGPLGKASKIKARNVGRVAVAAQADGNFLVAWTDNRTGKLWAADVTATGRAGKAFELQDTGESVDPDVIAAGRAGDLVFVAYAVQAEGEALRGVAVGTQ
jgi:hypothetical protein